MTGIIHPNEMLHLYDLTIFSIEKKFQIDLFAYL